MEKAFYLSFLMKGMVILMVLRNGWYNAEKGKYFVLTEKGKAECASYRHKTVGKPVDEYDTEAVKWAVESEYVKEVDIPGWTTLKGYEVVYYYNGHRLSAGNPMTFPTERAAKIYKENYESYPWMDHELFIEEVTYEGVPLNESQFYNGKEIIDKEHYLGLNACEIGSYFTEEMVNEFMDMLPPACMRSDCSQIGEPVSYKMDKTGNYHAVYATFKKIVENVWEYCGDCFRGENVSAGKEMAYL